MGTSTNRPSPNIPRWLPVKAVLGHQSVPAERQSAEIWRAAFADRQGKLLTELGSEIIARAGLIAGSAADVTTGLAELRQQVNASKSVGLAVDMATRALARACHIGGGRDLFAAELFAEAASYYASRDLPSVVAAVGKVPTTSESIALKERFRVVARSAVESAGSVPRDANDWSTYVARVADLLKKGGAR